MPEKFLKEIHKCPGCGGDLNIIEDSSKNPIQGAQRNKLIDQGFIIVRSGDTFICPHKDCEYQINFN